jgi:predicted transcriptional regulator
MDTGRALRVARRRGGLSQRALADRAGVPQPAIARIERGTVVPRVDTLDRLLNACGHSLEVEHRLGVGVDRTVIRELLRLTPRERIQRAAQEAAFLERFLTARRKT